MKGATFSFSLTSGVFLLTGMTSSMEDAEDEESEEDEESSEESSEDEELKEAGDAFPPPHWQEGGLCS